MFTGIITTANTYEEDSVVGGVLDPNKVKGTLKEYQTVVAIGPNVRNVKVGDVVIINPARYAVHKFEENTIKKDFLTNNVIRYDFNFIELDGRNCLKIEENDIDLVLEEFEEVNQP
jgi:hypothetical protein